MRHFRLEVGFTLLELLIVLAIISALTAIATPQYTEYKQRAFDFRALSDLRSVALAEEAYFMESERYLSCENEGCTALPGIAKLSAGVDLRVEATEDGFTGTASHPRGTGKAYAWDNVSGGLIQ